MSKDGLGVFVATTTGPVEVQRLTREDPDLSSVVCLQGKAVALPISGAYEAFVRAPTGVIQRCFGHPAFRADVSARIDDGLSWQLALFLAHAVDRHVGAAPPVRLVATGEVDRDLNVLAVGHVAAKLQALIDQNDAFVGCIFYIPRGSQDQVAALSSAAEQAGVRLVPVSGVDDMLSDAGLPTIGHMASNIERKAPLAAGVMADPAAAHGFDGGLADLSAGGRTKGWGWSRAAAIFLLLLMAAGGGFAAWLANGPVMAWHELYAAGRVAELDTALEGATSPEAALQADIFRGWIDSWRLDPASIHVVISPKRGPDGKICGASASIESKVRKNDGLLDDFGPLGGRAQRSTSRLADETASCPVEVSVSLPGGAGASARLMWWADGEGSRAPADNSVALSSLNGRMRWAGSLSDDWNAEGLYRVIVIAGPHPITGPQPWFPVLLALGTEGRPAERAWRVKRRLERAGLTVRLVERRI